MIWAQLILRKQEEMSELMAFERLEDVTGDDRDLTLEIVNLFADTTESYLDRLKEASATDPGDWPAASHALKGCCANFGAMALADTAKLCESEPPSAARIQELTTLLAQTRALLSERYQCELA